MNVLVLRTVNDVHLACWRYCCCSAAFNPNSWRGSVEGLVYSSCMASGWCLLRSSFCSSFFCVILHRDLQPCLRWFVGTLQHVTIKDKKNAFVVKLGWVHYFNHAYGSNREAGLAHYASVSYCLHKESVSQLEFMSQGPWRAEFSTRYQKSLFAPLETLWCALPVSN